MAYASMAKYSTLLLLTISIFFNLNQSSNCTSDHCSTPSCKTDDVFFRIHFPFRLPQFKSNPSCGYSDLFTLSCGSNNKTLLHLPNSGSFAVEVIDYYQQSLFITDPSNCFPRRVFDGFDLSGSPFTFSTSFSPQTYTYYNCTYINPRDRYYFNPINCMSGPNYTIVTSSGGPKIEPNCTVIKTVYGPGIYGNEQEMLFQLYWSEPACQTCLSNDGICGFKGHPRTVGCHSSKGRSLSDGAKYALILGISIPAFFIIMILIHRQSTRSVQQPPVETELVRNNLAANNVATGRPTIESYPKFTLGHNDAQLEPNSGPCSICLCEYKAQETLRSIPDCNHYFHSDCVDEWLKLNATCPVCRNI